ncbi:uncharacterized protein LOC110722184 [Chenopodium quinoa]|uniref:uncharacterized protein LOC110722184 n=1 Tax=Chenopodium quinoa TaxID=63459 RepID=UPI000B7896AB|nr:uncharacterized protein LOC110722184 [Chenopodium quinoa]
MAVIASRIGEPWAQQQQWPNSQQAWQQQQAWVVPPSSFPTVGQYQPQPILTRPPQQAYSNGPASYGPPMTLTELGSAYSSMTFSTPENRWYMDSGATSHMTNNVDTLLPLFNLSTNNHILVGNGHHIPITGYDHTILPNNSLRLNNVLLAPQIIKNLNYVRIYTSDNSMSIEFDPNGLSLKDICTGRVITRCNSVRELYLVTTNTPSTCLATSLTAVTPWHDHVGHPGASSLKFLRSNN